MLPKLNEANLSTRRKLSALGGSMRQRVITDAWWLGAAGRMAEGGHAILAHRGSSCGERVRNGRKPLERWG